MSCLSVLRRNIVISKISNTLNIKCFFFFQVCVSVAMCATSSVLISDSLFPPRSHFHHSSLGRRMRPSKFSFVLLINLQSANWVRASRIHQRTDKSHRWREMLVYRKKQQSNLMIKPVEGGNRKYKWRWVKKCSLWSGVFVRRIISWPDIHQPHKWLVLQLMSCPVLFCLQVVLIICSVNSVKQQIDKQSGLVVL